MKVKTRFKNMDIFERAEAYLRSRLDRRLLVFLLPLALLFVAWPQNLSALQDEQDVTQASQGQQYIHQTRQQLQQLVAPIALYPDSLVAQILAASTFPESVVEADQWAHAHPDLKGDALAQAVDQQPWEPSVKALIVNGKMTGGFAFVAYPAEYRSSGVLTFIVGVDGVVYQKDLGNKTEVLAKGMKEYNPDSSWQETKQQEEMAADPKASGKK